MCVHMCVSNFCKTFTYPKFLKLHKITKNEIAGMNHYVFPSFPYPMFPTVLWNHHLSVGDYFFLNFLFEPYPQEHY